MDEMCTEGSFWNIIDAVINGKDSYNSIIAQILCVRSSCRRLGAKVNFYVAFLKWKLLFVVLNAMFRWFDNIIVAEIESMFLFDSSCRNWPLFGTRSYSRSIWKWNRGNPTTFVMLYYIHLPMGCFPKCTAFRRLRNENSMSDLFCQVRKIGCMLCTVQAISYENPHELSYHIWMTISQYYRPGKHISGTGMHFMHTNLDGQFHCNFKHSA